MTGRPLPPATLRRRVAMALLVAGVASLHLLAADAVVPWGGGGGSNGIRRIEVAFVQVLQPSAPPVAAPQPLRSAVRPKRASVVARAEAAASEPRPAAPVPQPADLEPAAAVAESPASAAEPLLAAAPTASVSASASASSSVSASASASTSSPAEPAPPEPVIAAAATSALPAAAASAAEATDAAGAAFDWPLSTRLTYRLTGNYRGPIEGRASVEWLRQGPRYQVHLSVSIGPAFAPLITRRMVSDGELSASGLVPRRYDEETHVVLRGPRRRQMTFDDDVVRLANGTVVARPQGLQDTASQFVQMTWWFTMHPDRLRPGGHFDVPLALPNRVEPFRYEILDAEAIETPVGTLGVVHLKPRRVAQRSGDLIAESWIAPTLQYLPVRILIRQDEETWLDMILERLPEQGAATSATGAAVTARP